MERERERERERGREWWERERERTWKVRKAEESRIRKITKTRQPLIYNLLIHGPTSAHPWTPCPHFTCFLAVPSLSPSPFFFFFFHNIQLFWDFFTKRVLGPTLFFPSFFHQASKIWDGFYFSFLVFCFSKWRKRQNISWQHVQ